VGVGVREVEEGGVSWGGGSARKGRVMSSRTAGRDLTGEMQSSMTLRTSGSFTELEGLRPPALHTCRGTTATNYLGLRTSIHSY